MGKPGPFYHVNDVNEGGGLGVFNHENIIMVDKGEGIPDWTFGIYVLHPDQVFHFVRYEKSNAWTVTRSKRPRLSSSIFHVGTPPPSVYPGRQRWGGIIHVIKWTSRSLPFWHSAIKNWTVGRPGTRLVFHFIPGHDMPPQICNLQNCVH